MPKKFVTRRDVPVATPGSSADSCPGGSRTRDVEWPSLTKADLEQFTKTFTALDVTRNGTLDGGDLAGVLRGHNAAMSKLYGRELKDDELGDIWHLADEDGSGDIDPEGFALMMYLIRCASDGIIIPKSRKEFPPGRFPPMAEEPPEKEPAKKESETKEPEDASSSPEASDSASAELARLKQAHAALAEKLDQAEDRAEASEAEAEVLRRRFYACETAREGAEAARKEAEAEAAEAKRDAHSAAAAMASKGDERTKMLTERADQAKADEEKARAAQERAEADSKAATARAEAAEAARAEAEAALVAAARRATKAELDAQVHEASTEHASQDAEVEIKERRLAEVEIKERRLAESARDVAVLRATAADERADKAEAAATAAARAEKTATSRALAALAAMRRVAQLAGDKLAQRELIRDAAAEEDERVDESGASAREARKALFSLPPLAPEDAGADVEDVLAATVRAFQAHLVDVVEERKRLRDTFGASPGSSGNPGRFGASSPGAGKSPRDSRALNAWGDPPSRSSDPEELRAELERVRRYAARLQSKREEAVRGALELENAAARAEEAHNERARDERARADAAERDLDAAMEKFRVLRAETTRLREDAENLRMVNRALSRELYGGGTGSRGGSAPPLTPSRGDLRREFESGGHKVRAANAFLRESGVAAAAMEGVGALEGSGARLGGRRREGVEEIADADDAFSERQGDASSERASNDGGDVGGEGETRETRAGSGSLPRAPRDAETDPQAAAVTTSTAARARASHPAASHVSASQAMASAAKQAKEATSTAAAAMAASAAARASSLRFAESRRRAARGDGFSPFPGARAEKGSAWRPVGGALTSSGTVRVRSVAVLRRTHPGGTFGPPRRLFRDETSATKPDDPLVFGPRAPPRSTVSGDGAPDWLLDARFAYDERVAAARAATAARLEAAEAREVAKLRASPSPGEMTRLPAHLRPREDAPTAEDVDKAVKRFVKLFAEHGVAVRLTRQAPFKYVLEQAGASARDALGARRAKKTLMLKLERSRLVVRRGGAAATRAPAADLVDAISGFAAPAKPAMSKKPLSSRTPVSVSSASPVSAASARASDPPSTRRAPGLGKDKAWLAGAKRTGGLASRASASSASSASRARVSRGAYNVASDMTFVPAPDAPPFTAPRAKGSESSAGGGGFADEAFESSAERRRLEMAFAASGGAGGADTAKTLPTGPRPFLRDDAPGASPVRAGAPAPATKKPRAKPAPEPATSASARDPSPNPTSALSAADDDWDLP